MIHRTSTSLFLALLACLVTAAPTGATILSTGASTPINEPLDFTTTDTIVVGAAGSGTLTVDSGSELRTPNLAAGLFVGDDGDVEVTGIGSAIILTDPFPDEFSGAGIGQEGTGSLSIVAGGVFDYRTEIGADCEPHNCNIIFGNGAGSTSTLLIDGTGSSLLTGSIAATGGAFVLGQAGVSASGFGTQGGATVVDATVRAGGLLDTFGCIIGQGALGDGIDGTETTDTTLTIEDATSLWRISSPAPRECWIGTLTGGAATVTVRNQAQIEAEPNAPIHVGREGAVGTLALETGASATMQRLLVGTIGGMGTLTLDPTASLTLQGQSSAGGGAVLALGLGGGVGTATIEGALLVDASAGGTGAGVAVGTEPASSGTLDVQGASASLDVSGPASIVVGYQGGSTGTLRVLGGGFVGVGGTGQGVYVGAAGNGTLEVADAGSTVNAGDFVSIGLAAPGHVSVSGGGQIIASQVTLAGAGATLSGDGTVQAPVQADFGRIEPGTSPGTLTLDAITLDGATLEIEVAGTSPGSFDSLDVLGTADLTSGAIDFVIAPGVDVSSPVDLVIVTAAGGLIYTPGGFVVQADQGGAPVSATVVQESPTSLKVTLVPEPASSAALVCGVVALACLGRRRASVAT